MKPFLTLHDPGTARGYYEAGLWRGETFYGLLARHAQARPEAMALRDGRVFLDWQGLKARVDAMADNLVEEGLVAGDRLSVWMSNRVEVVITFLACAREGIACNPSLHRSYTCAEIVELLNELGARALVTEPGWGADRAERDFEAMLSEVPSLGKVYTPERFPGHITQVNRVAHGNPDSVVYLAFTSGTTGRPKCVMHSSNTLLANARDLARDWALSDQSVILTLSPFSHHIAWVALGQWLVCGGTLVMDDPPEGMSRLDWITETGATYVLGVPTHAMDILAEQKRRGLERLGQVQTFYMAGAPIPEVVAKAFVDQGIAPQNIYGMTECSSHQYTHPGDPPEVWIRTCGRGGPAYEVRIWDPEDPDRELAPGQSGEIGGRGAAMMLGYFANQAATERTMNRHGYLLSGDLGSFDGQGNLRIEGRIKDLIIRGGHNIFPSRIEALALSHPRVEKAAAFGVPDARLGEKVCLAVIGDVGAAEMLAHLAREGLSKFDMPEWFAAVEDLPLTASGKILKRELAQMVARGALSPEPVRYGARKQGV
ncbi:class I adenylate-forming enzyme family protein [Celeribacter indicus]|uniref:AMP-dependent synthetase and ligase n=1 Tax=Celeribacter indicus TaxID=1208324 RepID=A0A0B5E0J7_9RHOB|nr:class I adenylate-forming enzyme family protein [Celeribacter indicus]AJE49168.1 AMP-dependent synthetase and ligase [Celeribacter indicus]AJE49196.1 AMP-dependent synthetase and ligase [Celeribacter indicus]SDX17998.1 acyl-CoA synthetase [Celeribacter indicus]SDX18576.1 acyl-CoA synthetase [Celeribacter indicus]